MEILIMDWIKKYWWKVLGILLLLYAVIVGLGVPLKPGIVTASPLSLHAGESVSIKVKGYNSNFDKVENRAWLLIGDEYLLQADNVSSSSYTDLNANFVLPPSLPVSDSLSEVTLVVSNSTDGNMILPSFVISQKIIDVNSGMENWSHSLLTDIDQVKKFRFPYRNILHETIRNNFYHVSLWFAMFLILITGIIYNIRYLFNPSSILDKRAHSLVTVATLLGVLGIMTGSIWAKYTWGAFWTADVKLNMTAVAILIYLAYQVLRSSIDDHDRRARISAVYSIFAFVALMILVMVIPRLTASLHPGNGGNPALGGEDLDHTLRTVFYPSIIGFTLVGLWIASLLFRFDVLKDKILSH